MLPSEPFTPIHSHDAANPADRDIDIDIDVFFENEIDDPDGERSAEQQCARALTSPFRTPKPGTALNEEELREDIAPGLHAQEETSANHT